MEDEGGKKKDFFSFDYFFNAQCACKDTLQRIKKWFFVIKTKFFELSFFWDCC